MGWWFSAKLHKLKKIKVCFGVWRLIKKTKNTWHHSRITPYGGFLIYPFKMHSRSSRFQTLSDISNPFKVDKFISPIITTGLQIQLYFFQTDRHLFPLLNRSNKMSVNAERWASQIECFVSKLVPSKGSFSNSMPCVLSNVFRSIVSNLLN